MNLDPGLKERIKGLLGGKNVTKRRMETLVEELEQARLLREADPGGPSNPHVGIPQVPPPFEEMVAAPGMNPAPRVAALPLPGPDEPEEEDDDDISTPFDVPAREPVVTLPPPPMFQDPEKQLMYELLQSLKAEVVALRKPATQQEKDEAIGAGKLPLVTVPAGPVGYTGQASLPRGVWFPSPLGPKVPMRLCDCGDCSPFRVNHYWCSICKSGPHHYKQAYPYGRKMWMAPGSTWGVPHETCSPLCWQQYLALIGRQPGVNESEPPRSVEPGQPERPAVPVGSD